MSTSGYQRDRINEAARFEADFAARLKRMQTALRREVTTYLAANLQPDKEGKIRLTVTNVRTTNNLLEVVRNFAQRRGRVLLAWVIRRLTDLFRINTNYFRSLLEYPRNTDEKALRLLMLRLGYDTKLRRVLPAGYLARVFHLTGVAASISRDIQQALTANLTLAAFRTAFSKRFEASGYVMRWFQQFTGDLFHQFDASAQATLAQELDLQHFQYAGTSMRNTRCFCDRRLNRIYTRDFAALWNEIEWRGKIPNGNFFIDRGGYNCRHHLSYITQRRAERLARQRGVAINTYNDAECNEKTS